MMSPRDDDRSIRFEWSDEIRPQSEIDECPSNRVVSVVVTGEKRAPAGRRKVVVGAN